LIDAETGREVAMARTDLDGRFRFLTIPRARYFVVASAELRACGVQGPFELPDPSGCRQIEQRLTSESRVSVHVVDEGGRNVPLASIEATLSDRPPALAKVSRITDSGGRLELTRLASAIVTLRASKPGYLSSPTSTFGLAAGEQRSVELMLGLAGSLTVAVLDVSGEPAPHVNVTIIPIDRPEDTSARRTKSTGTTGIATFSGLRPGRYDIECDAIGNTVTSVPGGAETTVTIGGSR
jgi:hypothetical protein